MSKWAIGDEAVNRKNTYMPCALGPRYDEADDAEKARLLRATYWADNITAAEWPVVLSAEDAKAHNRSRLKRKTAGWLMAAARIAVLNPELFATAVEQARAMYIDQTGDDFPWAVFATRLAGLPPAPPGGETLLQTFSNLDEDGDT